MELSAEPIIYGLIFVGVIVLVEGIYLVTFGKSINLNNRVNRRLDMLDKGGNREQVLEQLRKEMQQHMKSRSIPLYSLLADRAQKAVSESVAVAEALIQEHRATIQADVLAMAKDLNRVAAQVQGDPALLTRLIASQAGARGLSEAMVFDRSG